jgi:hypothetical protein
LYGTLYPHLPLADGDRIVALENWNVAANNEERHALHDLAGWRDQMTSVVEISAFHTVDAILESGSRGPELARIAERTIERAAGGLVMKGLPAVAIPVITLTVIAVGALAAVGPTRRGLRFPPTDALKDY